MNRLHMIGIFSFVLPVANVTVAFAQQVTTPGPSPEGPQGNTPVPPQTTTSPYFPGTPGSGGQRPTGPLGGGNIAGTSSSRPITGSERDSFDLLPKGGAGGGTARGDKDGPIFSGSGVRMGGDVPFFHMVRRGDTLSGICDYYFHNPYQWPRVWSYNPQIHNPHWIYPGDQVRLKQGTAPATPQARGGGLIDRRRQVVPDTVFLRSEGFIEDSSDENWGEITGAPEDKMFLSTLDEVYVRLGTDRDVKLGQELTIFRPVRSVQSGQVVQIQGTIKVNQWNPKERIARGTITEALDVIERGARVGPLGRRLQVVPPVRNDIDLRAGIITSVHPHNFYGQNQVLFIDKGADDGLKVGNRLFIVRRGDAWRRTLQAPGAANRISPEAENLPEMEKTPGSKDDAKYPDEIIGELRVVALRKKTATCIVTQSKAELERSDVAVARKGY
jgi:hypothetical protein